MPAHRFMLATGLVLLLIATAPATAGDHLVLIRYGGDTAVREGLIAETSVFADLGGRVVARVSAAQVAALRERLPAVDLIGEPAAGEVLASVANVGGDWRPTGVRILRAEADLFLVAGLPQAVEALKRPGIYAGGVMPIPLDKAYVATKFQAPGQLLLAPDPRISALVAQVQSANLMTHIQALSSIWTRRAERPENAAAITYLLTELAKLPNLTVTQHKFSSTYGPNVIAELKGYESPNDIVMVGGHIDSTTSYSSGQAPGADDNASGSATVLELARIFSTRPFEKTIRFAWWNAEEKGLVGSAAWVSMAKSRGDKIVAYINTDMTAYRASGDTTDVDFILNDSTPSLVTYLTNTANTYTPTLGVKSGYFSRGTSDHRSFYRAGFAACFPFEDIDKYSPYIHTSNDTATLSTNDMNLATLITQMVGAGLAGLALPLSPPSYLLGTTSGPSVGGTPITVFGQFLRSTQGVTVGGKSVPFTVSGGNVTFQTPTSATLGAVAVEITNPGGPGKSTFTYKLTQPADIRVPAQMQPGGSAIGALGGTPGHLGVTLMSVVAGATNMGVVTVDIGGGSPGNIIFWNIAALSAGGGTGQFSLFVPNDPRLIGWAFHFQGVVVEPSLKSVEKTPVRAVVVK